MFGRRITLFKLFGFEVKIDISWFILALLITWSLAEGVFPHYFEGLSTPTRWIMGVGGAVGLFVSIVFHEFCHSIVARSQGLPMKGITLFVFGGVAEMEDEPPSPKAEFLMAVAGPASSIVLGAVFLAIYLGARGSGWPVPVSAVFIYLGIINIVLAAFNLLPAFPLDGGRILRSALWAWKKNIKWSTRLASGIGSAFGITLIVMGVLFFFTGNFVGGIWWVFIGLFLRGASQMSYQRLIMRKELEGEPLSRFMNENPVTAPSSISLEEFVQDYVYRHHFKMFPVVDGGTLLGCISIKQIKEIPREEWGSKTVADVADRCSSQNTIKADEDAMKALTTMNQTGNSRLLVVDDGHLVGIISLKDLLKFLSLKLDLEGDMDTKRLRVNR
jgi:Zn-dependent protease/predicted transcriptional regulator